jgi:hypothetical protein
MMGMMAFIAANCQCRMPPMFQLLCNNASSRAGPLQFRYRPDIRRQRADPNPCGMIRLPPAAPKTPRHLWIAAALVCVAPRAVFGAPTGVTGPGWSQSVFAAPMALGLVAMVLTLVGVMKPAGHLIWRFGAPLVVGGLALFGAGPIVSCLQYAAMAVR